MAGWNHQRVAVGAIGILAMVAMVWAISSRVVTAQDPEHSEPGRFPTVPSTPVDPIGEIPKSMDPGDDVQPAQFMMPAGQLPGSLTTPTKPVADPPAPVVRIQVRVPADSPPGDDIKYLITIQNTSSADAHGVSVRNPVPDSIEKPVKSEPGWDKDSNTKELIWKFGTLAAGKSKTIELTLRPKKDAGEVKNLAYVKFEHGEAVTTRINKPVVKITKTAPKQTVRDEQYVVRIAVDNTGRVPVEKVRIAENVPASAEIQPDHSGRRPHGAAARTAVGLGNREAHARRAEVHRVPYHRPRRERRVRPHQSRRPRRGFRPSPNQPHGVLVPGLSIKLRARPQRRR